MEQLNHTYHILLADDDQDHAKLFHRVIKDEYPSTRVSFVQDGQELMRFLNLNHVDLIFLDLNMPCKTGFECLNEIKIQKRFQDLPVVVYSSSAHLSDIQRSFMHKADFYLVKPFRTDHLKNALKMILSVNWKEDPPIRHHYFINNSFVPYTDRV